MKRDVVSFASRGSGVRIPSAPPLISCMGQPKMVYFVYVLQSEATGKHYIGSTADINQRLLRHNAGRMPSTKHGIPWRVIHQETFNTLSEARRREMQIKSWKSPDYLRRALGVTK